MSGCTEFCLLKPFLGIQVWLLHRTGHSNTMLVLVDLQYFKESLLVSLLLSVTCG